jgi:FlaA1/EpsC-like NDP-sugar epimerase
MTLRKTRKFTSEIRNRHFFFLDLTIVTISPLFALFLRMEGTIPNTVFGTNLLLLTLILGVIKISIFYSVGLYNRFWISASVDELIRIIIAGILTLLSGTLVIYISRIFEFGVTGHFPLSLPALDSIITIALVSFSRFSLRIIETMNNRFESKKADSNVIILGAGSTGKMVLDEILMHPSKGRVIGFLDDDKNKLNLKINGIPILGTTEEIEYFVEKKVVRKVIIAMAATSGKEIKSIHNICKNLDVELLTIPSMHSIINNKISFTSIKKVNMADLLRRESVVTNSDKLEKLIHDKVVFISGAGGSIGSEIVRQIMKHKPMKLLMFGKGENSIFEIQQEVLDTMKSSADVLVPIVGDVRNENRVKSILEKYKPNVVFHAAAHKHVPLMEANIEEAFTNNVLGTKNLVTSCSNNGVEKFILISTDKAVNPTSIMGVSKRIAEMVVLNEAEKTGLSYSAVRFGNVLGSRGSVVNTFKKQIANGGPIKVTHKDIKRYFMTIPEAVQLVLQASILNNGGEIFVLDMGEPVRIVDLAKDMIHFSGLKYKDDIDIVFTGLRPGEKLFEELFFDCENYKKTSHKMIFSTTNAIKNTHPLFDVLIQELIARAKVNNGDINGYFDIIKELVPEYKFFNKNEIQYYQNNVS